MKIFPLVALVAPGSHLRALRRFVFGVLLISPLLIWTLIEVFALVTTTPTSAYYSFGLISFGYLLDELGLKFGLNVETGTGPLAIVLAGTIAVTGAVYWFLRDLYGALAQRISSNRRASDIVLIFATVFFAVLIVTASWAYRAVFLVPVGLVIFNAVPWRAAVPRQKAFSAGFIGLILIAMWLPAFSDRWIVFNPAMVVVGAALMPVYLHLWLKTVVTYWPSSQKPADS